MNWLFCDMIGMLCDVKNIYFIMCVHVSVNKQCFPISLRGSYGW